jgi:hypothetical protein
MFAKEDPRKFDSRLIRLIEGFCSASSCSRRILVVSL